MKPNRWFYQGFLIFITSQDYISQLPDQAMVRCLECSHMFQPDGDKEQYFCLNARDYITHEIDENIGCKGYENINESNNRWFYPHTQLRAMRGGVGSMFCDVHDARASGAFSVALISKCKKEFQSIYNNINWLQVSNIFLFIANFSEGCFVSKS